MKRCLRDQKAHDTPHGQTKAPPRACDMRLLSTSPTGDLWRAQRRGRSPPKERPLEGQPFLSTNHRSQKAVRTLNTWRETTDPDRVVSSALSFKEEGFYTFSEEQKLSLIPIWLH